MGNKKFEIFEFSIIGVNNRANKIMVLEGFKVK